MNQSICICDDGGVEVHLTYDRELAPYHYCDHDQYYPHIHNLAYTELISVEIKIAGRCIDVLDQLTNDQKYYLIRKLDQCFY